jgi:serine/threonine-protein kinase
VKVCTACGIEYTDDVLFCQRDGTPLRSAEPTRDLIGQILAERYHVTKKLGEGGMGQVYLAEHVKMGRRCAIKIMSQGMINDPDAVSRFNREAANASRINHANVCSIYDFGETKEGLIYLAMEFIEGKSLTDLLHDTGPLLLPRAAGIILQCAEALQAAHDLGIVHRDLKPDNIMVISARGRDVVKVVDFGIAKATGADSGGQKVTKTGLVVGTPEYMSPEQLSGDALDGRSDIYSLALVFYRMVTGRLPFVAETAQETMIKRLTDDPIPLAQARPDGRFPAGLQAIMDRALARWPTDRYASAAEFGRDVQVASGSMTGPIDTEGATQTVQAVDMKPRTVPLTRIDPAAASLANPKPKAPPPAKRFPVMPVAVGTLIVAVGGGAFAMKDRFLAGARPDSLVSPRDTTRPDSARKDPGIIPLSHPDTTHAVKTDTTASVRAIPPAQHGTAAKPARDSVNKNGPSRTDPLPRDPAVVLKELDSMLDTMIESPSRRAVFRTRTETIYNDALLPAAVRATAAANVGQSYMEDKDFSNARDWFIKATALDPKYQRLVDNVDRKNPS